MHPVQLMLPMIWVFYPLILLNLFTLIVSTIFINGRINLFGVWLYLIRLMNYALLNLICLFSLASDSNTIIYTAATSGTDHNIKIWRIYGLKDLENTNTSRLVPQSPQVL